VTSERSTVDRVASRRDFREFIDYPYTRNATDPHWIPPLRMGERERLSPKHNPFFDHAEVELFLARRGGQVVGRIAAIDDHLHNEVHNDNVLMFGFFEAADEQATTALFDTVERWGRDRGRAHVRGPMNPSLNESAGLLIEGFDTEPMVLMPRNPAEYPRFIEGAGYRKIKDLFAWIYMTDTPPHPIGERLAKRVQERLGVTVRPLSLKEFKREVAWLREVYCGAWEKNWGFTPPTHREFERVARELKPIFDERGAVCAEINGKPIGCLVAVPDINQVLKGTTGRLTPSLILRLLTRKRIIDQGRILLMGVLPEYRGFGLAPLMMLQLHRQTVGTEYRRVEFSWILEDNRDINQPAEMIGAKKYQIYRIYQKSL